MIKAITKTGTIKINPSKELGAGGEGIIYEIDSNTVAKIYHPGIKPIDVSKFQFLSGLDPNYFVAPLELLYDSNGVVIGYTMRYVDQSFFPLSNLYSKNFCKSSGITKKVKMKIIEKLIAAVKYAHKENVVIGDLNPFNILVNDKGVVKFIDTDSYETPGHPHSHILLDDIRDYYYQGRVNKDSDFFAMSILTFNMLSFLHPFKGMHKTYKKIGDRMIHKLPVFINDPDITIPKCYEPIQDKNFMDQFKKLYLQGERFLLSLTGVDGSIIATSPLAKPSLVKKYEQDDLLITMILQDSDEILNIKFLDKKGVIETESEFIIYDSSNKGYLTLKHRINKTGWDKIFIGNENILLKKGDELWSYKNDNSVELMKNFKFPSVHIITQMEDILVVIGPDDMYKLFIDKIGAGTVMTEHIGVYGKGFSNHSGFIHNSGGKQNVFYNSGKNLSIVSSPVTQLNGVYQKKNVGIIQYVENKKMRFKFFKIDNLKIKISNIDLDGISNFAFLPNVDSKGKVDVEGTIFYPADDKIFIYRTNDFEKVGEMNCGIVTSQSVIHKCDAGIIVWDENTVALLNKK
ncbi:MAG: RIO1 family regulatory kinase/ATPase [Nanoarchaeota archaeon]